MSHKGRFMVFADYRGTFALVAGCLAAACATGDVASDAQGTPDDVSVAPSDSGADAVDDDAPDPNGEVDAGDATTPGTDAGDATTPGTDAGDATAPSGPDAHAVDGAPPSPDAAKTTDASGLDSGSTSPGAPDAGCVGRLVVNELQSGGTTASDEFVELYNPTSCPVSLVGWTLRYAAASGTTVSTAWTGAAGKSIPAFGYAVVAGGGFSGAPTVGAFVGTGTLAAAGGGIGIYDPSGARMDSVGYGAATNPLVETSAAPAPAPSTSIARKPDGVDHDDNATDLQIEATPTPGAAN